MIQLLPTPFAGCFPPGTTGEPRRRVSNGSASETPEVLTRDELLRCSIRITCSATEASSRRSKHSTTSRVIPREAPYVAGGRGSGRDHGVHERRGSLNPSDRVGLKPTRRFERGQGFFSLSQHGGREGKGTPALARDISARLSRPISMWALEIEMAAIRAGRFRLPGASVPTSLQLIIAASNYSFGVEIPNDPTLGRVSAWLLGLADSRSTMRSKYAA